MWRQVMPGLYEGVPLSSADAEKLGVRIKISNLPLVTRETHRFETWEHSGGTEEAYTAAQKFLDCPDPLPFLSLLGGVGLGKTHLSIAIAWRWLERGIGTVLYYQVENLLDELRWRYRDWRHDGESDPYELIDYAKNCSLCILDDLGAHKATEWAEAKLDEIIDARYINRRATIITSNLPINQWSARIADRAAEGVVMILDGKSRRKAR